VRRGFGLLERAGVRQPRIRMRRSSTIQSMPVTGSSGSRLNTRRIAAFNSDVCLVDEPEHDDTCGPGWRVSEDVGKVQVQRDERALLAIAYVKDPVVWLTAKSLLNDGMSIVPGSLKYQRQ
jgi:hypothetical protein